MGERPRVLRNDDPAGYAWGVWRDRTPLLLAGVRDGNAYPGRIRAALDALGEEIAGGVMAPSRYGGDWARWGEGQVGTPWLTAPFLWSESFFFRRLLEAVDHFEPGPWQGVDPFGYAKARELTGAGIAADLAGAADRDGPERLLAALWGNQSDLGFRIGMDGEPGTGAVVVDDGKAFWAALSPAARVVYVADNAGRELAADLLLIWHLLAEGLADRVELHVKPRPYYVSDATTADVLACLRRIGQADEGVAERLRLMVADGRLELRTHEFYCSPWAYSRTPPDLRERYAAADLTVFKGDLNYRRLTGDLDWPPTTPLATAMAALPGRVAALRTLKSDTLAGVPAATLAAQPGDAWRTDGSHALLQVYGEA